MALLLFVLGKNPELSLAEIAAVLEAGSIRFRIREFSPGFALLESPGLPPGLGQLLGGTLKVAEVLCSSDTLEGAAGDLDVGTIARSLPDKPLVGVSAPSPEDQEFLEGFLKERLKAEGLRPGFLHADGPGVGHAEVSRKRLLERGAEFVAWHGREWYLGRTIGVHNPYEFRKRDLERPVQRTMLGIPPRLCRIMINLTGGKGILADPFCGIGSILQEAILMGWDVRGVDKDPGCVRDCLKNLRWLERSYGVRILDLEKKIFRGDAQGLGKLAGEWTVDAIATEPPLGPPLKGRPSGERAGNILGELKGLYREAIRGMLSAVRPGGRIVLSSPCFRQGGEVRGLDLAAVARELGASLRDPLEGAGIPHRFPFLEMESRHSTGRQIWVIEKA